MRAQAAEEGRRAEHDARGRTVKGHHPARRRGRHVPGVAGRQAGAVVVGVVVPEVIFKRLVVCLRRGLFLPVTGPEGRDLLAGIFAAAGAPPSPSSPMPGMMAPGGRSLAAGAASLRTGESCSLLPSWGWKRKRQEHWGQVAITECAGARSGGKGRLKPH